MRYSWPGNIRELQNVIERAVILSAGSSLQLPEGDLQITDAQPSVASTASITQVEPAAAATVTLADAEREHIVAALRDTAWTVGGPKGAATRLELKRSTLLRKMKKLGISRTESRPPAPPAVHDDGGGRDPSSVDWRFACAGPRPVVLRHDHLVGPVWNSESMSPQNARRDRARGDARESYGKSIRRSMNQE